MACPKCGSESLPEVVIEERYDGVWNPTTQETEVDYSCVTREVSVICPDCGDDYPSNSISNPK